MREAATIGAGLKQLRREKSADEHRDVAQTEVAKEVGVPAVNYSRYESGKRETPPEVLEDLAKYFGVRSMDIRSYTPPAKRGKTAPRVSPYRDEPPAAKRGEKAG